MLDAAALLLLAQGLILEPGVPHPCAAPCAPPRRPKVIVTVRAELRQPPPRLLLRDIAAEMRKVWRAYVDLEVAVPGGVGQAIGDDMLTLVLTARTSTVGDPGALGWIDFVNGEPAKTITVSLTAAQELAAASRWEGKPIPAWPSSVRERFLARALGRAAAHEVGHYLLRSKTHTPRGLMRQRFPVGEIMSVNLNGYRLDHVEQQMLARRTTAYMLARRQGTEDAPPAP